MDIIKNDFKTIQLVCYNSQIDELKYRVHRYLLAKLLISHNDLFTTKLAMSVRLEALYGALLSARTELNGNINTMGISLTIPDPKIVGDPKLLEEAIFFFKSILFEHHQFDEAIFEDEKRLLMEQWHALKDNKSAFANHRFQRLFRLPDLSGYPLSGSMKEIKHITLEEVKNYYNHHFLNADMQIIVNGNIDYDDVRELKHVVLEKELPFKMSFRRMRALKEQVETTDMNQAIVKLGYVFPVFRFDLDYDAALLANVILGGYPESRLFKTIREELALCYDISSNYDPYTGTLMISSGVGIKQAQFAKEAIIKLVDTLIKEGMTDEELALAKGYVIHQFKSGLDHQSYFTRMAYYRYLTKHDEPVERRIAHIEDVLIADINRVVKSLKLDTIYILTGEQ